LITTEDCWDIFEYTNGRLQRADQRLSNPTPSASIITGLHSEVFSVLPDNEMSAAMIESLLLPGFSQTTLSMSDIYLVQIAPVDFESLSPNKDISVEAAILLYNYGVAYRFLSLSTAASDPFSEKLKLGALRLFRVANASLELIRGTATSCATSLSAPSSDYNRILLVSVLSLRQLALMCSQFGYEHEYYTHQLASLRSTVLALSAFEDQCAFEDQFARPSCSAAA
jgi:hypothetical protein